MDERLENKLNEVSKYLKLEIRELLADYAPAYLVYALEYGQELVLKRLIQHGYIAAYLIGVKVEDEYQQLIQEEEELVGTQNTELPRFVRWEDTIGFVSYFDYIVLD